MAGITLVQHGQNSGGEVLSSCTVTLSGTTAGNCLIVGIRVSNSATSVTGITDNATGSSNTYVHQTGADATNNTHGNSVFSQIWTVQNCKAGATSVTVSFNSPVLCWIDVSEWSGVSTSTGPTTYTHTDSTESSPVNGATISPSNAGQNLNYHVLGYSFFTSSYSLVSGSFTELTGFGAPGGWCYYIETGSGSFTPSYTAGAPNDITASGVSFVSLATTVTASLSGETRVKKNFTSSQVGHTRVKKTLTASQVGTTRVRHNLFINAQTGNTRVKKTFTASETGHCMVAVRHTASLSGTCRVAGHTASLVGSTRIQKTFSASQVGHTMVAILGTANQSGLTRVKKNFTASEVGQTRVQKNLTASQTGHCFIAKLFSASQVGTTRVKKTGITASQQGETRVKKKFTASQVGHCKITTPTYPWQITQIVRNTANFANRVIFIGGPSAVDGTQLTSTVNDTVSQTALGRIITAQVINRQITTQGTCDLAAAVELARRAPQYTLTFNFWQDGFEVGDVVPINSTNAAINGNYEIQQLTFTQISTNGGQLKTMYTATCGTFVPSFVQQVLALARATNPAYLPPTPPPANSVSNSMIQAGAVETLQLAANAVATANIQVNAITTSLIAASAITTTTIASNAITTPKIATGAITAAVIAAGTITATQIASGTIVASNIQAGTITAALITAGTITSTQIAASTITGGNIASATITGSNITGGTITGTQIASATISGSNIASATIAGSNIQNGTITGTQIASATITGSNIVGGTITGTQISGATITGSNIASSTITDANISSLSASKITAGTISASISMTSPSLTITSGSVTLNVDATNIVKISDTSNHVTCQLTSTALTIASTSNSHQGGITSTALTFLNASGQDAVVLSGASGAGSLLLYSSGSPVTSLDTQLTVNNVSCINSSGTFVGAGVNTGSTGIAGGGFNPFISGVQYFGATGSFTAGSNTVTVKGGVIVSIV